MYHLQFTGNISKKPVGIFLLDSYLKNVVQKIEYKQKNNQT